MCSFLNGIVFTNKFFTIFYAQQRHCSLTFFSHSMITHHHRSVADSHFFCCLLNLYDLLVVIGDWNSLKFMAENIVAADAVTPGTGQKKEYFINGSG